ncbi:MAG TPA: peptide deformylase [Nitrospiria bacterium]|nr:peptide deformylase [Nitrospiria bacterium]
MAIRDIVEFPASVLKEKTQPVKDIDKGLQLLIDDMFETMYAAPGIGLAAPQIGISLRLFVYDLKESEDAPRYKGVMINPEIIEKSGTQSDDEGCLSVADYRTRVTRANKVKVKGLDREGKPITLEGEGLMARLLQHEIDHLDGCLLLDRISSLKRQMYIKRLKKRKKAEAEEHHHH